MSSTIPQKRKALDDDTNSEPKKLKTGDAQHSSPSLYTISNDKTKDKFGARAITEKDLFIIVTTDNYKPSGSDGVSSTIGRIPFPQVVKLYNEQFGENV